MADKNYKLTFAMSDGTSKSVQFAAPQGPTGATGSRGTGVLKVTTAPSSYTTATGGFTPTYRIALSTVKSQAEVAAVLVGDTIMYSYYHYPVGYVDTSYVYLGARNSIRGATGAAGANGTNGANGYTPVKGTDYFTAADQEAIVQQVIAALGTPVFGTIDENNVITLSGNLGDGTFTFVYEDEDGVIHDMCELTVGEIVEQIVNWIPLSTDTDGSIYNGKGWNANLRVSSSGSIKEQSGYELTGFIPFVKGDILRGGAGIVGLIASGSAANTGYNVISLYNSSKTFIANVELKVGTTAAGVTINADDSFVFDSAVNSTVTASVAFIRVTTVNISDSSILTVNQEIA